MSMSLATNGMRTCSRVEVLLGTEFVYILATGDNQSTEEGKPAICRFMGWMGQRTLAVTLLLYSPVGEEREALIDLGAFSFLGKTSDSQWGTSIDSDRSNSVSSRRLHDDTSLYTILFDSYLNSWLFLAGRIASRQLCGSS